MGRLDIRVVEARNLPDMDMFGKSDPYVKIELENQTHKTDVCDDTLNPKWDAVFKFIIADPDSAQLEMTLWNSDTFSDDFMGKYHLNVSGLVKGEVSDKWCLLKQCKSNAEIRVRLLALDFGEDPSPDQQQMQMQQQQQQQQPNNMMMNNQQQQQYQNTPPQMQQQPMMQQQPNMMMNNQQQNMMGQQNNNMQMGGMGGMQQMHQQQMGMQQQQQPINPMNPSQTFQDMQFVQFQGPVRRATYGPPGQDRDYTMQVNQMIQRGQTSVSGGIHTAIGDPAPGVPKQFKVWY